MNLQQLDQMLRQITEHELEYKNGKTIDYASIYDTRIINGKKVLFCNFGKLSVRNGGLLLFAKKHSRFQAFPEHCHSDIEINYMYAGNCTQVINGKKYTLSEGQLIFLNSDTVHQIEPLGEDDILLNLNIENKYLTSNFFNRFSSESIVTRFFLDALTEGVAHNDFLIFHSQNSDRLRLFIGEFMCEWYSPSLVTADILNSLLTLILTETINVYKHELSSQEDLNKNPVIPVLHYIEANYQNCSLTDTARFFNINPNYLSNLLKKHTGYSYRELVLHQKINTAKQLLRSSSMSVIEIAAYIGYNNVSFFYKKFQEEVGCLPGDYRQRIST
ncbi:MAG: AraC family transcriptional regulator [Lachnospiraceae bacterium]|nr:AraC family transcriptional regulator [Lachnospiraceae bacterium]